MDQNPPKDQTNNQPPADASPKQSVVARIQQSQNVLVTVKSNPTVDELAATIGLTLLLNKLGKHATAVFSGKIPNTLEFLKPEETLESNTDSLRDFIVSLDKSKADKLRYKVEEDVVRIYITPYRTSITEADLEFTQGDFNVDVIVALGVTSRDDLDQAITVHGRILHDASVVTVNSGTNISDVGQLNWQDAAASSLSEMLVSISEAFQGGLIDEQIATAFLTGIVSETERFSNPKTTPKVMTMAAQLMAAGANQQLIANELDKAIEVPLPELSSEKPSEETPPMPVEEGHPDGSLSIDHSDDHEKDKESEEPSEELPEPAAVEPPEEPKEEPLLPPSQQKGEALLPSVEEEPVKDGEEYNPLMGGGEEDKPNENFGDKPKEPLLPPPPGLVEDVPPNHKEGDIHIDEHGNFSKPVVEPKHKVIEPLTDDEPKFDPIAASAESATPVSSATPTPGFAPEAATPPAAEAPEPAAPTVLPPAPVMDMSPSEPIKDDTTLLEIEESVHSPHLQGQVSSDTAPLVLPTPEVSVPELNPATDANAARNAVSSAFAGADFNPAGQPRADVGALPLSAPPASASFDSFRLTTPAASGRVTDVSGNLPNDEATTAPLPPPPVPPPMTGV